MSSVSLYQHLRQHDQLLEVAVDDLNILFPGSARNAVGTRGLNGCTCVVILGHAIILAHISPLPDSYEQWRDPSLDVRNASSKHHDNFLEGIERLMTQYAAYFPPSTSTWGIFCHGEGGIVENSRQIVHEKLSAMGYLINTSFYPEFDAEQTAPVPAKGEVVALFRHGRAQLYVERAKVWAQDIMSMPFTGTAASPSAFPPTLICDIQDEASRDQNFDVVAFARAHVALGESLDRLVHLIAQMLDIDQEAAIALLHQQSQHLDDSEGSEVEKAEDDVTFKSTNARSI